MNVNKHWNWKTDNNLNIFNFVIFYILGWKNEKTDSIIHYQNLFWSKTFSAKYKIVISINNKTSINSIIESNTSISDFFDVL